MQALSLALCYAASQVALVHAAGQPTQRVWRATLDRILQATAGEGQLSPSVFVVGRVTALLEQARQQ